MTSSEWTDTDEQRRQGLIFLDGVSGLDPNEQREFDELQERFGRYQDSIAPLPDDDDDSSDDLLADDDHSPPLTAEELDAELERRIAASGIVMSTPEPGTPNSQRPDVGDLAMLVRRLCYRLSKHEPKCKLIAQANDYLRRKNLQGSILRSEGDGNQVS